MRRPGVRSTARRTPPDRAAQNGPTGRPAGLREVAELARVAASSVSRVLTGHPDVSPAMRQRVLDAVAELRYEPDFVAQSLRRGVTMSVGVILRDISSLFMSQIVASAEPVLRAAGYSLLLMNSGGDPDLDVEHIQFFQARRVDGMILQLANDRRRKTFDWLARSVAPVVLVDREAPARVRASSVLTNHQAGMRDAVESLIDLGHQRIALVSGAPDVRPSRERLAGLEATMRSRGLASPIVVAGQLTEAHGEAATEQLLGMTDPPTAIVMGSNQLLAGALRTFRSRGIVPGDQVSLVSCDDSPLSELYRPPISVIDRDSREMGRLAAELILDRMVSAGDPRSEVVGTTYIARPSCAPPPPKVQGRAAAGRG